MKGFVKRLAASILMLTTWWIIIIQYIVWLFRGKGLSAIDKYMNWLVIDLME